MADLTPEQLIAAEKAAIADGIKAKKDGAKAAEKQRKKDEKRWSSTNKDTQAEINKEYEISQEKVAQEKRKQLEEDRKEAGDDYVKKEVELSVSAGLAKQFAAAKDETKKGIEEKDLEKQIKGMGSIFNTEEDNETQKALLTEFKSVSSGLKNPDLNPLERRVLEGRMEELKSASGDEEERREKQEEAEASKNIMNRMADGIDNFGTSFDKFRDGMMVGGGILAALGTIAMLFFEPEELMAGMTIALEKVRDIIDGITTIFTEGWEPGMEKLDGHMGTVGAIIAGIVLYFGGTIIGVFAGAFRRVSSLASFAVKFGKGIKALSAGIRLAAVATGGVFSSMLTGLIGFLAPFAIPIAIAVAIAAVIGLIGYTLTKLRDSLGFESVWDVIWLGVAYLKDGLGKLGNLFIDLYNKIAGLVGRFASWLGFDMPDIAIDRLAVDNAVKFKAAAQQKKIENDAMKAALVEEEKHQIDNDLKNANFGKMLDGVPSGVNIGPMLDPEQDLIDSMNEEAALKKAAKPKVIDEDAVIKDYQDQFGLSEIDDVIKPMNMQHAADLKRAKNEVDLLALQEKLADDRSQGLVNDAVTQANMAITTNNANSQTTNIVTTGGKQGPARSMIGTFNPSNR
jgi:hypothetical protein